MSKNNIGCGLDIGTAFLCSARKGDDGAIQYKKIRDAFLDLEPDQSEMLSLSGINFFEKDGKAIVVGEEAMKLANLLRREARRPLSKGIISPHEIDAVEILYKLIEAILGPPQVADEICYYSVPATPIDSDRDVIYHQAVFSKIISDLGYTPRPRNEAYAVVFSECKKSNFSGLTFSWGAGMVNSCLAGNTEIPLLDGTTKHIKELAQLCEKTPEKRFWVYACKEDGEIVPAQAYNARKTGHRKLLKIVLDNKKEIRCTEDHRILLRDGQFITAGELKPGDSLMPFCSWKQKYKRSNQYYQFVKSNKTGKYCAVHKMVAQETFRVLNSNEVVHHKDFNGLNNIPENLQIMTKSEHSTFHSFLGKYGIENTGKTYEQIYGIERARQIKEKIKTTQSLPKIRKRIFKGLNTARERMIERRSGKTYTEIYGDSRASEVIKKQSEAKSGKTKEEILGSKKAALECNAKISQAGIGKFGKYVRTPEIKNKIAKTLNGNIPWNKGLTGNVYKEHFQMGFSNQKGRNYNHKVVAVEYLPAEDVYDITVDKYHNFAIKAGVFVHNCLAYLGTPILEFSVSKGGDWIDESAARSLGKTASRLCAIKEQPTFNLMEPRSREEEVLAVYYKSLILYALDNVVKKFISVEGGANLNEAIPMVVTGGTTMAKGFLELIKAAFAEKYDKFPIMIKDIRQADEPLYSVAHGLLMSSIKAIGENK